MTAQEGPEGDRQVTHRRGPSFRERARAAPLTFGIIAVTSVIFLAQLVTSQISGFDVLLALGAKDHRAIAAGQIWRYVTPIFLHVDPLHLMVNMYSLYIIGPPVERPYGAARFAAVYALSGVGGVAFSLAFSSQPSAGASGAIFGLLGALAGFMYLHRELTGAAGRGQLRHILLVAAINLAIGLSPGIDNWGHLGGLLCGVALALLLGPRFEVQRQEDLPPRVVDQRPTGQIVPRAFVAALVILLLAAAARVSPFRG